MKKYFIVTAIVNLLVAVISFILFVTYALLELYLGISIGSPKWLVWVPSVFFICSGFNFLSAYLHGKLLKKLREES